MLQFDGNLLIVLTYYYSIRHINIGGICICNGHAAKCDIKNIFQPRKLVCKCLHNTDGPHCTSCLPGFQQKKWQPSTDYKNFICEPCNCFGHSNVCKYDGAVDEKHASLDIHGNYEGGGVCQNCAHNTEGINCNRCRSRFYRPRGKSLNATDVCQPCDCDYFYSTGNCADFTGKCECRKEFAPPRCDSCNDGYFDYPNCEPCECNFNGTKGNHCKPTEGSCPCKKNYTGRHCNLCAQGYYNKEKTPGFLRCVKLKPRNMLQISLKFKTQATDGLIFYATNPDETADSVLSLADGRLLLKSQDEELGTASSAGINDNEWHVVTAYLHIDGLPNAFDNDTSDSRVAKPFVGHIGNTTLNGTVIHFTNMKESLNEFPGKSTGREQVVAPVSPRESRVIQVDLRLPCMLPVDLDTKNTWKFAGDKNSRLEYTSLPGRYEDGYKFQIDIKTLNYEGIVFYASNFKASDFIAVYVEDGKVNYQFDCGSGSAFLRSESRIDDNQWHTVVFTRQSNYGELLVDEDQAITGYSQGNAKTINVTPPFYVGGFLPEISSNVLENIRIDSSFTGCLGGFMMNGQTIGEPEKRLDVIPCSRQVEPSLFFYPADGINFFETIENFRVGRVRKIRMDIKPRSSSGHLLWIHDTRNYVLLEMINGTIKIKAADATGGVIETSFKPTLPNSLCDGNWHIIRAIFLRNDEVQLSVDDQDAPPGIGTNNPTDNFFKRPIYIGGSPSLTKLQGSTPRAQYVGCMRNIIINNEPVNLDPKKASGNVWTGECPTF